MTAFLVHPLGEQVAAYVYHASPLGLGWLVDDAKDEEAAALAIHSVMRAPSRRYAVQGKAGVVLIDLERPAGTETFRLDEGPHR